MTSLVPEMFKQTCRTCLSTNGEMVPIFSSGFYVKQLPKKLMAFTEVEISNNDALPKVICKKCMFMADSFYCFKEQCESADNRLKLLIRIGSKEDNLSNGKEKLDSELASNRISLTLATAASSDSKKSDFSFKNVKKAANNVAERCQDSEDDYVVEYISDDVKMDVENSMKRRQEAERRISMEKVSRSIKNLKGIEVVPISDLAATRHGRSSKMKKEDIVVFPVKVQNKRRKTIETIVLDETPPLNKRIRLPPETSFTKINGDDVKTEDSSIVYGRHKRLNFSTIRKVVKIIDEELCVEPKKENIKDLDGQCNLVKNDYDMAVASDIQNDEKGADINSKKQDSELIQGKLQGEPKEEDQSLETAAHRENIVDRDENKKEIDAKAITKYNCYSSTVEEQSTGILNSQELKYDEDRSKLENNFQDHDVVAKSTIGCIISEIEGQNVHEINITDDEDGLLTLDNANSSSKNVFDYRPDKRNEVFIENEVCSTRDNCSILHGDKTDESLYFHGKSCLESMKIEQRKDDEDFKSNTEVTPLALLSVNSSGEENKTINLKIYKRNESERVEETMEDQSSLENLCSIAISAQKAANSNMKFYQCTVCSIHFVTMPAVLKHNIQVHMPDEAPYFCLICDKRFEDKPPLSVHVEEHNGAKPYKCTFCPKTFTLKRNLKRHVNQHINYKPFQCRTCMKRFSEKSSLKSHTYLHTGESPFACKTCNVSFNNKTNWRRHVMTIHEKLTLVVCKLCNKELPDKRSLQVHTRVHTGDRPYQCPHCDKRFTQQCNLNTHIHCHLNDRPFGCPHCGKGFNQRGTRDDHILIHTGEKPHKCTECEASFTVLSALKRHMWVHTDKNRPYNCEKCKLQFVGLYDLRRHLKSRHGEVVKLENPRVERVVVDEQNKDKEGSDALGETVPGSNEPGTADAARSFSEVEITAKENNSLSCNVTKYEDSQMEEAEQSLSDCKLKIENFSNGAKKEAINNSET